VNQPGTILRNGTSVRTSEQLDDGRGLPLQGHRKPGAPGTIAGVVGGFGGDVYWVRHDDDGSVGAYCFTEFELDGEEKEADAALLLHLAPRG
jgi:hypothetical protein